MIPPANDKGVPRRLAGSLLARSLFPFRRWIVACLIVLWIAAAIASHIPPDDLPKLPTNGKVLHVLGFLTLATLFQLTLGSYGMSSVRRNLWVLLVFSAYAALDEGTQPYFHRHGCVSDWMLDTASAALSLGVWEGILLASRLLVERRQRAQYMQRRIDAYLNAHPQQASEGAQNPAPGRENTAGPQPPPAGRAAAADSDTLR